MEDLRLIYTLSDTFSFLKIFSILSNGFIPKLNHWSLLSNSSMGNAYDTINGS